MADPTEIFDPIKNRMVALPRDRPTIYELQPNRYNGLDVLITFGGFTVSFNTNEQRLVHIGRTVLEQEIKKISEELSQMRAEAGREPFDIPQATVTLLDNVINHHIAQNVRADEAHWVKVNLVYGPDDRAKVIDERVSPISKALSSYFEERREEEAQKVLKSEESTPQASPPRDLVPQTTAPPAEPLVVATWDLSPPRPYRGRDLNSPTNNWMHFGRPSGQGGGQGGS